MPLRFLVGLFEFGKIAPSNEIKIKLNKGEKLFVGFLFVTRGSEDFTFVNISHVIKEKEESFPPSTI